MNKVISNAKAANMTLENGPAANMLYFTTSLCLVIFFSSGSTKAPIKGPKKTIPELRTGTPLAFATMPCENSCTRTTMKRAIMPYQKGTTIGLPGIGTPGIIGAITGAAPGTNKRS